MAKVHQSAGNCAIEVWTDGAPLCPTLTVRAINGEWVEARVGMNDLHDLRYCIDRVLSQLGDSAT